MKKEEECRPEMKEQVRKSETQIVSRERLAVNIEVR